MTSHSNIDRASGVRMALGLAFACLLLGGCAKTMVADNLQPPPSVPAMPVAYLIQPGDQLDVKFVKNPELDEQPTVQPDGRISMLYAPDLLVGGQSTTEVRSALDDAYSKQLLEPGVSVNIKGPVFWHIYVGGQVAKPSDYTQSGPTPNLSAAIAYAGGLLDSGDGNKVVLTRLQPNHRRIAYLVDYYSAEQGKTPDGDVQLEPYDVIYVPRTGIGNVYMEYNQYFKQFVQGIVGLCVTCL